MYRRALKKAERYRQRRVRELAVQHGGYLSAGVSAMIGSAARAYASSLVLHELADELLVVGALGCGVPIVLGHRARACAAGWLPREVPS